MLHKFLSIVMLKVATMPRAPLGIMTLIIIAFSIMTELYVECYILFIFMLNIIMLSAVMLSVVTLSVINLRVIMLSVKC